MKVFGLFSKPFSILIVCFANITRSPFFATYLEKLLVDCPLPHKSKVKVSSAGIHATQGTPAHMIMSLIAESHEVNLRGHRSKPVDGKIIDSSNIILTMEMNHKYEILEKYPEAEGKVYSVLEFGRIGNELESWDVPDPTGREQEDYEEFLNLTVNEAPRVRDALEIWMDNHGIK